MVAKRLALCLAAATIFARQANGASHNGSSTITAPKGEETLTVGVIGDYGWFGFRPLPLHFCNEVLPNLKAAGITIPREIQNDCDPGDRADAFNASAFQVDTANYIAQVCAIKNCGAFISVGDSFYDSGVELNSDGIIRFEESFVQMYGQGVYQDKVWYQTLGNHDIVKGQPGVDFVTKIAPIYDPRWNFGTEGLPYYKYDLVGADWTARVVVVDSDCFLNAYQETTSVYMNDYITTCFQDTEVQVDFLKTNFENSDATWKILQIHHPYISSSGNNTELAPLMGIAEAHNAFVIMGHDHCLAHYVFNNTNHILSGAAGFPQPGDCNNGVALGPFAKFLGANGLQAANGFVTLDISKHSVNVEYYARDMQFEDSDLYPVRKDLSPTYNFKITEKAK